MKKERMLLGIAVLAAASMPAGAQWGGGRYGNYGNTISFRPRFSNMNTNGADGRCIIRVRIDDQADVSMNGDTVTVRALTGRPGRDEGSECTSPMPRGASVQFRGIDGRGDVRLIQNNPPVVRIVDSKGGDEGYTFELRWAGNGYYNNGPYSNNGPYNNGPYSNGPYNNGPYNNGPYYPNDRNGGWWGNGNGNGRYDPYAQNNAVGACESAAANEISRRYGLNDLYPMRNAVNDRPGNRDDVYGIMQSRRTGQQFSYECRVNSNNGRVRDVRVNRR